MAGLLNLGRYVTCVWASILLSYVLFIGMFIGMQGMGLYEAEFFHLGTAVNDTTPVMILGVTLKTRMQFNGCVAFFFFNSFFSVWNGIVIAPIFEGMIYDDEYDITQWGGGLWAGRFVMFFYEIWRGGRSFFSLLGMTSNVAFFAATAGGALVGSLITKSAYSTQLGRQWLHHPNVKKTREQIQQPIDHVAAKYPGLRHSNLHTRKGGI